MKKSIENLPVVIMAGGKGTRLDPYTKILPKPLIPIGDITITEHIMNQFSKFGYDDFIMVTNYKREMIKAYFNDEEVNVNVKFVEEESPLGTGGGLKLLEKTVDETFFVINCDTLILDNYKEMVGFHKEKHNVITMVCAQKKMTFLYGTVDVDENDTVTGINEKPGISFLTNTGMYILEPEVLKLIPENTFTHMTEIIETCLEKGKKVGAYTINEDNWIDMGQMDELKEMRKRILSENKEKQ